MRMKQLLITTILMGSLSISLASYEVWDVKFAGKSVGGDDDTYKLFSGSAKAWIVRYEANGNQVATLIEPWKSEEGVGQGPCTFNIEDYNNVDSPTSIKGLSGVQFTFGHDYVDMSGTALGKYAVTAGKNGPKSKSTIKGIGYGNADALDFPAYLHKFAARYNDKASAALNAAGADPKAAMEAIVAKKAKGEFNLDWSWIEGDSPKSSVQPNAVVLEPLSPVSVPVDSGFEVWDWVFSGKAIFEDEEYRIGSGKRKGWIVTYNRNESTTVLLERGEYDQGFGNMDFSFFQTSDTPTADKGYSAIEFNFEFREFNLIGTVLGKYVETGKGLKISTKGACDGYNHGYEAYYKYTIKRNTKLSAGINDAADAEQFMEDVVGKKVKTGVDLDWNWFAR